MAVREVNVNEVQGHTKQNPLQVHTWDLWITRNNTIACKTHSGATWATRRDIWFFENKPGLLRLFNGTDYVYPKFVQQETVDFLKKENIRDIYKKEAINMIHVDLNRAGEKKYIKTDGKIEFDTTMYSHTDVFFRNASWVIISDKSVDYPTGKLYTTIPIKDIVAGSKMEYIIPTQTEMNDLYNLGISRISVKNELYISNDTLENTTLVSDGHISAGGNIAINPMWIVVYKKNAPTTLYTKRPLYQLDLTKWKEFYGSFLKTSLNSTVKFSAYFM